MKIAQLAVLGGVCLASGSFAFAQSGRPAPRLARSAEVQEASRLAEANQLGLLQYCRLAGLVTAEIVERQRQVLNEIVASSGGGPALAEEDLGRHGIIAFQDSRVPLVEDAAAQGITVAYSCQLMGLRVSGPD